MTTVEDTVHSNSVGRIDAFKRVDARERVEWVDAAKGICIILVVLMHSTLGVEKALSVTTWLNGFIEWARPFRMPDFFLISGLFLSARINKPIAQFVDSKVLHFFYFYALWVTILFVVKDWPGFDKAFGQWLAHFIEPHGAIWFIYMLPVFMITIRVTRHISPYVMIAFAAILEALPIATGWTVIDEFAARFVYVYAGFWLAPHILGFAKTISHMSAAKIIAGLLAWAVINSALVWGGLSTLPIISLILGGLGALAVITVGVFLIQGSIGDIIQMLGKNSLVIYLAFTLFMSATRVALIKSSIDLDPGVIALSCMTAGIVGPLLLLRLSEYLKMDFLFKRPHWARLT